MLNQLGKGAPVRHYLAGPEGKLRILIMKVGSKEATVAENSWFMGSPYFAGAMDGE